MYSFPGNLMVLKMFRGNRANIKQHKTRQELCTIETACMPNIFFILYDN